MIPLSRKIIHIDMDCFYAAIEVRDNQRLRGKPVAVGGSPSERGVVASCNYEARGHGVRSAMATWQALTLCPELVILPVNMPKIKQAAKVIHRIMRQYTPLVEPLSLDEAFLDVSDCSYCQNSATLIAKTIKQRIKKELQLTASAGAAPNKFLAKVASEWNKPDGLFVIAPHQVAAFMQQLPVNKIFGVGKVTAKKLQNLGLRTCADMQKFSLAELVEQFGTFGGHLYQLCRGIDNSAVDPEWEPKSASVEETFAADLPTSAQCLSQLTPLCARLRRRLERIEKAAIKKQFVKIKFYDFTRTTVEIVVDGFDEQIFEELFLQGFKRGNGKPVRLIGVGVRLGSQGLVQKRIGEKMDAMEN